MTTQIKTKEIVTASGVKFILNETLTYGQHLKLMDVYLQKDDDRAKITNEANKLGIGFVVMSIDDTTENNYDRMTAMPYDDVQPILKAIKDILDPKV